MRRFACKKTLVPCLSATAGAQSVLKAIRRPVASDAFPERRLLHDNDSFLSGTSAMYVEQLYQDWKKNPSTVDASWNDLFSSKLLEEYEKPLLEYPIRVLPADGVQVGDIKQSLEDCDKLTRMIRAFIENGHLVANTNPLDYDNPDNTKQKVLQEFNEVFDFSLEHFGFSPADAEHVVKVGFLDEVGGVFSTNSQPMTIRSLYELLKRRYCGNIGFEFSHVVHDDEMRFIRTDIELEHSNSLLNYTLTNEDKLFIWDLVASSVFFEDFFTRKYSTQKRFGCDGAESLVVGLRALLETSAAYGVEKINLGMAHRGRLNVLHNIIGKPFEVILKEFLGLTRSELEPFQMSADVKYHLGCRSSLKLRNGKTMETEMLFNPSHLEAVNPLVQGFTAAEQFARGPDGPAKVLPIEIHGDASFSGQCVAYESIGISGTPKLGTHGTVHIVCNNQIGFTTDHKDSRSSIYCTDLARVYDCPILHVNGDSPEDVYRCCMFAATYRAMFNSSVVIDLVCYRRFGHNENDDPRITQPLMYARINAMPNLFRKYSDKLIAEKVIQSADFMTKAVAMKERYGGYVDIVKNVQYASYLRQCIPPKWRAMKHSDEMGKVTQGATTISQAAVQTTLRALQTYPKGFTVNPKLKDILERRNDSIAQGKGIEWGGAEVLAFASLLLEGHPVRVIGRDVERGTFAHRHAVLHDYAKVGTYIPLQHLAPEQGQFVISNSPFNEYGSLGYAAGYALEDPNRLVMWEAQYGDLANGAAIIFDQFLSSGESKWCQQQSCVVTLPHGYDGEGPEQSSGRLERFLQMSSEDASTPAYSKEERSHRVNWEVVFPSTPAQYFHVLRRHLKRDYRKPLIIFFSKRFLRAPNVSTLEEMLHGSFQPVLGDSSVPPQKARRLVLCTGQMYHILNQARAVNGNKDIALVRIEELSPFPVAEIQQVLKGYGKAELMWAQEEPKNMGAWGHVEAFIDVLVDGKRPLHYAGRPTAATSSTAYKDKHEAMQRHICETVFDD